MITSNSTRIYGQPAKFMNHLINDLLHSSSINNTGKFKTAPVIFDSENSPITLFFTKAYCFSNHFQCEKLEIDGRFFYNKQQQVQNFSIRD